MQFILPFAFNYLTEIDLKHQLAVINSTEKNQFGKLIFLHFLAVDLYGSISIDELFLSFNLLKTKVSLIALEIEQVLY